MRTFAWGYISCGVALIANSVGATTLPFVASTYTLEDTTLDLAGELLDVCERYGEAIDTNYPENESNILVQDARAEGLFGHDMCIKALTCAQSNEEPLMGCVELGLESAHKALTNIERDFPDAHLQLRLDLAQCAVDTVARHSTRSTPQVHQPSLESGEAALVLAFEALDHQTTTYAIIQAHEAYFWFVNALNPFENDANGAGIRDPNIGCDTANRLATQMAVYEEMLPPPDGIEAVQQIRLEMESVAELFQCLPDPELTESQPCFDVSVLTAIQRLSDMSRTLNTFRNGRDQPQYMVWTRNWRYGMARLIQARITRALFNLDAWIERGLIHPEYDPELILMANTNWEIAEAHINAVGDGNLDLFLQAFISTEAKCTIHYLYEMVLDWWEDASNPACAPLTPYTLPEACLDEDNINQWPIHGGTVIGGFEAPTCAVDDVVHGQLTGDHSDVGSATVLQPELLVRDEVNLLPDLTLCEGHDDWFALGLPLEIGDILNVALTQDALETPITIDIIDPDGISVLTAATSTVGSAEIETEALDEAGTYYIRVHASDTIDEDGATYNLTFTISAAPEESCVDDDHEPNNNPSESMIQREPYAPFSGTLCRETAGELDWYAFELAPGDSFQPVVTVTLPDGSSLGNDVFPFITLRSPDGDIRHLFDIDQDSVYELDNVVSVNEAGFWYVVVEGTFVGPGIGYTIDPNIHLLTCEENADPWDLVLIDAYEVNDSCAQATGLTLNPNDPLFFTPEGYICGPDQDEDWFSISVAEGARLSIGFEYFHFEGNLDMIMYDPNGDLVDLSFNNASCNDADMPPNIGNGLYNCELVVAPNTTAGRYCVQVFSHSFLTQNSFRIQAEIR